MKLPIDERIASSLGPYGIDSSARLCEQVRAYIALLLKWNQRVALTTVTDVDEILRFHFGESLFAVSSVPVENGRLADVGSGAGFPGLPLAMVCPKLHVTMIESNLKKFTFLNEAVRELSLENVEVVRQRMERIDLQSSGTLLDFVSARAVGQFGELLNWSHQQLSTTGRVVLWLGEADAQKLSTHPSWNWAPPVAIPGSDRRLILSGRPRS